MSAAMVHSALLRWLLTMSWRLADYFLPAIFDRKILNEF